MISFNLSVDFELGWGDLRRVAYDDAFYGRVVAGLEQTQNVLGILNRNALPSTWGVVGGCCCGSLDELRERAPRAFAVMEEQLRKVVARRPAYHEVLFCRGAVESISRSAGVELGSHGFMHLVPDNLRTDVLRDDVSASVRALHALSSKEVVSFIPPQNYHWPDQAFTHSGIRYVRHTPDIFGYAYSDPRTPAKFARLWNDLVRPVHHRDSGEPDVRLFFLRLDRGARVWSTQLLMIRRLIASGNGSVFCYIHPHNLDTPALVGRLAELCDVIAQGRDSGKLGFRRFCRELHSSEEALAKD